MAKNRGFFENLFEYYFLHIVNDYFFSDLNITVSTTLNYYHKQASNKKLKLMGGAMKCFLEKLLRHEIFSSMVPRAAKFFLKNLSNLLASRPEYLISAP